VAVTTDEIQFQRGFAEETRVDVGITMVNGFRFMADHAMGLSGTPGALEVPCRRAVDRSCAESDWHSTWR
jgi:hypothetical protein